MTNSRIIVLIALLLTTTNVALVASQANSQSQPASLFYERQTTTAAAILASTSSSSTTYTSRSTTSVGSPNTVAPNPDSNITEEEQKQVTELAKTEWSPKTLSKGQQEIAKELFKILDSFPQELVNLIAHYFYEFKGICTAAIIGQKRNYERGRYYPSQCGTMICTLSDGISFAVVTSDSIISLTDAKATYYKTVLEQHFEFIQDIVALGNNKLAATDGPSINIWDLTTDTIEHTMTFKRTGWQTNHLCALCALPNQQLVAADSSGEIQIWSLITKKLLLTIVAHTKEITSLIALSDNRFASCSMDGATKIWNTITGQCIKFFGTGGYITRICGFLPDNKLAVVSCRKPQKGAIVQVWDITNDTCTQIIETQSKPLKAMILPDGRIALASYDNAVIEILDVQTKETEKILLKNNSSEELGEVYLLGILADGRLVTSLQNGTLHIWR